MGFNLSPEYRKLSADAIRPLPEMDPATFAEINRILHEIYCTERPGKWSNDTFPYQRHVMNVVKEAIETGKKGVVFMKGGQIGGTDCMVNAMCWLKAYYPGPQLFMTSTEPVAREFGRERWELVIRDMPPLAKKYRPSKRGDILTKRFSDGKIQICGGQSVFNLQSTPYRIVGIDELDSLVQDLAGQGDPLSLAEVRTDSFSGPTLIIAWAHPSTKDRGAGKLFYESSDQRRGFVKHDCGFEFPLTMDGIECLGEKHDASSYKRICKQCGEVIEDATMVAMVRKLVYKSVLDPEIAKTKEWIGIHASQLYTPSKTTRSIMARKLECGDDQAKLKVFYNKVLGEPYEAETQVLDKDMLRKLVVVRRRKVDTEFYSRGFVPPMVRFLTAGQDSRATQFHYSIWGWGLRRDINKAVSLCGWLIDWGEVARPHSLTFSNAEYHVFDSLIYRRQFPCTDGKRNYSVMQCGHDIAYAPTQTPIIKYCRSHAHRAFPVRGAAIDATSSCTSPYVKWGSAMKLKIDGEDFTDQNSRALILNTFMLKTDLYGWMTPTSQIEIPDLVGVETVGIRKLYRICFPEDVDDDILNQLSAEKCVNGSKKGELIWKKTRQKNHQGDTATYALGLAYNADPFQANKTAEEYRSSVKSTRVFESTQTSQSDPAMG